MIARTLHRLWRAAAVTVPLALTGCPEPYTLKLADINEEPFSPTWRDGPAVMQISDPQLFARETLINDRRTEAAYIRAELTKSVEANFTPQLARELSRISALALDLGIAVDPAKGAAFGRGKETAAAQQAVDLARLQLELANLRKQIAAVEAAEPAAPADGGGGQADGGQATDTAVTPASRTAITQTLTGMLDRLEKQLANMPPPATAVTALTANPDEVYEDRRAFRNRLRADLLENDLDDMHDKNGRSIFRMQFRAAVMPGTDQAKAKWGIARLTAEPPMLDENEVASLYQAWLRHVTYRLNDEPISGTRNANNLPDRLYELLAAGSGLFDIVRFYVSGLARSRLTGIDDCLTVTDPLVATAKGCITIYLAAPPQRAQDLSPPFVGFKDFLLGLYVRKVNPTTDDVAQCPTSESQVGTPEIVSLSDLEDKVFKIAKDTSNGRLKSVLKEIKTKRCEKITDEKKPLKEAIDRFNNQSQRLFQQHPVDDPPDVALSGHSNPIARQSAEILTETENSFSVTWNHINRLTEAMESSDVVKLFPHCDAISYAKRMLGYGPLGAVAEGLVSKRDMPPNVRQFTLTTMAQFQAAVQNALRVANKAARPGGVERITIKDVPKVFIDALFTKEKDESESEEHSARRSRIYRAKGSVAAYATAPVELAQSVSSIASAADALQFALAASGAVPGKGLGAEAALGYSRNAVGKVQALERTPLVIGFSDRINANPCSSKADPCSSKATFGWIFGPKVRLDPDGRKLVLEHGVANRSVTADLTLPGWWPWVDLKPETAWIGNWHDGELLASSPARTLPVIRRTLPRNRADLDGLTNILAEATIGGALRVTRISRVIPQTISACTDQELTLLVYGTNVWRSTAANLMGLQADEDQIRVLPDMEGVSVTFNLTDSATGDGGKPRKLAKLYTKKGDRKLTLWTRDGYDSVDVEITGGLDKDGNCKDVRDPEIGPSIAVVPQQIAGCAATATFVVTPRGLGTPTRAWLGGAEASVASINPPVALAEGETPPPAPVSVTTTSFPERRGLSTLPLTVADANGTVASADITLVGGTACTPPQAGVTIAPPASAQALSFDGCAGKATFLLAGSNLDQVVKGRLLEVEANAELEQNGQVLRLRFDGLPAFSKDRKPPPTVPLTLVTKDGKRPAVAVTPTPCG